MIRIVLPLVLLASMAALPDKAEAQLFSKLGKYAARKLFGESTETAGKQLGKKAVASATKTAGGKAASTSISAAGKSAASKTSKALVGKFTSKYGNDSALALSKCSSRSGRRLALIEGEIAKSGQGTQLMTFLAKRSDCDAVVDWLYRNSGKIAAGALIAKLIAFPEEVLGAVSGSVSEVVAATGEKMAAPIAEAAKPLWHWLGFTCFAASMVAMCGWLVRTRLATPKFIQEED